MLDDRLLDAIYASTHDDGALHDALGGLSRVCHSRCAGVFQLGPSGLEWQLDHGMPSGFMAEFGAQVNSDPRVALALAKPELTLLDDNDPGVRRAMHASGTDHLARRWDLPWTLAVVCARDTTSAWSLYLSRSAGQGPSHGVERELFAQYSRHFVRAMRLRIAVGQRAHASGWIDAVGEREIVRIVIDGTARVRQIDSQAEQLMARVAGVSIRNGRLTLANLHDRVQFNQMIEYLAKAPRGGGFAGNFRLPRPRDGASVSLHVDTSPGRNTRCGGRLLAVWLERRAGLRESHRDDAAETVTPRQLDVLRLIERGYATDEVAASLGIAVGTVRVHIKQLLAITDTHNRRACIVAARCRGWI